MLDTMTCPSGLTGRIRGMKVSEERVLPSGNVTFDAERNEQGHADRFWAMALACQTERGGGRRPVEVNVRVVGGKSKW